MVTGPQIKTARERLGENQAQFAQRFGVDQSTIHRWETKGLPDRGTASIAVETVLAELPAPTSEPERQAS